MSADPNLVVEAKQLLAKLSTPARDLAIANQYGPLEARLAGAVLAIARKPPEHLVAAPAAHYRCSRCDAKMQTWQDFPEYQHVTCGGLVKLDAVLDAEATAEEATNHLQTCVDVLKDVLPILEERLLGGTELVNQIRDAIVNAEANVLD